MGQRLSVPSCESPVPSYTSASSCRDAAAGLLHSGNEWQCRNPAAASHIEDAKEQEGTPCLWYPPGSANDHWGGARAPPRTPSASPGGGGGSQPCIGLGVVCIRRALCKMHVMSTMYLAHTAHCRGDGGQDGRAMSEPMHGSVQPYG